MTGVLSPRLHVSHCLWSRSMVSLCRWLHWAGKAPCTTQAPVQGKAPFPRSVGPGRGGSTYIVYMQPRRPRGRHRDIGGTDLTHNSPHMYFYFSSFEWHIDIKKHFSRDCCISGAGMTTFYQHLHSWLESVHSDIKSIKFSWSGGLNTIKLWVFVKCLMITLYIIRR